MPGIEVAKLMFASDDVCWASWRFIAEEEIPSLSHTKDVIEAYVTAGTRIQFCTYQDMLQERAVNCDTDSVLYVQPRDESAFVEKWDNLGAMNSELKLSFIIEEFVSGVLKNYAFKFFDSATDK